MQLNNAFFARPQPRLPANVMKVLKEIGEAGLSEEQDELFTNANGVAPGYPEAFVTKKTRDAALGPYGDYVEFIPTSWHEFMNAGFGVPDIAVGPAFGQPGFVKLASTVIDAVASRMQATDAPGSVVIARVRYDIHATESDVSISGCPEFGVDASRNRITQTMRWLRAEFAKRLVATDAI